MARGYANVSRLRRKLRRMEDEIVDPVKEAIAEGGFLVQAEAKRLVPVDHGTLRDSLEVDVSRDELAAKVGVLSKRAKKRAYYGYFVEMGTRAGIIGDRALVGIKKNGKQRLRKVRRTHPGTPARPFLFPAFEKSKGRIRDLIAKAVNRALAKVSTDGG